MDTPVLVVGAGPAGLAVTACLKRRAVHPTVVDRGSAVGDSWRRRYDRLHLHTPHAQSQLPGLPIPRQCGRWVARDDVVGYLEGYARHHDIAPQFGMEVRRLRRVADHWRVTTTKGELRTLQVIVATGYSHTPKIPRWPGRETFTGDVIHASAYRNPSGHVGRDVLVVGTGNTGAEIAADLAEGGAGRVRLAVRTPPNIVPRELGPLPTTLLGIPQDLCPSWLVDPLNRVLQRRFVGDLRPYGLPAATKGIVAQFRATDVIPIIDVGLVEQLRLRRVEPVAAVERYDGDRVVLADKTRIRCDVVIAATGYEPNLTPMVGHLGVLDGAGRPRVSGAHCHPAAPGLRFLGLRNRLKGLLFQINLDARAVARAVARELASR